MGGARNAGQRTPLLAPDQDGKEGAGWLESLPTIPQELRIQAKMAVPLAIGHVTNFLLTVISLAFVGHIGTQELAAASLSYVLYNITARVLLAGLLGGLDTFASQAVGGGQFEVLGSYFWQGVLFLMLHTVPIAALFTSLPGLLTRLGQSPEITRLVRPYLLSLLPAVWIDAVYRPLNRIMIAQRITTPTAWVSIIAAVQHVPATHLFVRKLGWLGAAWASVWSSLLALLLAMAFVRATKLQPRVWGIPDGLQFQSWKPYIKLSYASCAMVAIAYLSSSLVTVAAGWLPNPTEALAAAAVASSVYGLVTMCFAAMSQTVCIRVGHGLGSGSAARAKLSARATASIVPFLWLIVASILVAPKSQLAVISLFTSSAAESLLHHLHYILGLLAVQLLLDTSNAVLSGTLSGAGKQGVAFLMVAMAHWGCGLPSALLLAFRFDFGIMGLYSGMFLGPVLLLFCYSMLVWRTRWDEEAERAYQRILAVHSVSATTRAGAEGSFAVDP